MQLRVIALGRQRELPKNQTQSTTVARELGSQFSCTTRIMVMSRHQNQLVRQTVIVDLRVSPSQRRKVKSGPQAALAHLPPHFSSFRRLHTRHPSTAPKRRKMWLPPPSRRSLRAALHAPPTPARSGHPVVCHAARNSRLSARTSGAGDRRASQQHDPRRAPPAPSLLPAGCWLRPGVRPTNSGKLHQRIKIKRRRQVRCPKSA